MLDSVISAMVISMSTTLEMQSYNTIRYAEVQNVMQEEVVVPLFVVQDHSLGFSSIYYFIPPHKKDTFSDLID